jgi:hypothetical protein
MGVGGDDMSSLEPNSGRDEDGWIQQSKWCHDADWTEPHPTLGRGCCRCGSAVLGTDVDGSTPTERNVRLR